MQLKHDRQTKRTSGKRQISMQFAHNYLGENWRRNCGPEEVEEVEPKTWPTSELVAKIPTAN